MTAGQALVELALVTPLILVLFAGAGDLGRAFYGYIALENATKEGVLYGSRHPLCATPGTLCPDPDNVKWRFQQELGPSLANADGTQLTPTSTCYAPDGTARTDLHLCVAGDTYTVQATYTFAPLTPVLSSIIGGNLTVSTKSTASVLNQAFDPTPGIAPTKLVSTTNAINASEVTGNCTEPDPTGSPGFYRSPCVDKANSTVTHELRFYRGAAITYKVVVRNNGGTNLTGVTVTDSQGATGCAFLNVLPVNGMLTPCTYQRTAPTPTGSNTTTQYVNVVTAASNEATATTDTVTVQAELPPAHLSVTKWVSPYQLGSDGDGVPDFGTATSLTVTHSAKLSSPYAWFYIRVVNTGGVTATGLTIADTNGALPYGQNSATAVCDAKPTSLAGGATFNCKYKWPQSTNGTYANNVTVSSPDDPSSPASTSAMVTVASCTGSNQVMPSFIGLSKTDALTAWNNSGLTGTFSNIANGSVVTQSQAAFACVPTNSGVTLTKTATP